MNSTIFKNSTILTNEQSLRLVKLFNFSTNLSWNLIYQASVNGFSASNFHTICGTTRNTLTIIKTTNSFVFGGFTSSDWSADGYFNSYYGSQAKYDPKGFLFSLVNGYNISVKMNLNKLLYPIQTSYSSGPIFGINNDIYIADRSNININSYSKVSNGFQSPSFLFNSSLAGTYNFMTTEIEVYSVYRNLNSNSNSDF